MRPSLRETLVFLIVLNRVPLSHGNFCPFGALCLFLFSYFVHLALFCINFLVEKKNIFNQKYPFWNQVEHFPGCHCKPPSHPVQMPPKTYSPKKQVPKSVNIGGEKSRRDDTKRCTTLSLMWESWKNLQFGLDYFSVSL